MLKKTSLTGGSPSSFCHTGVLGGFESTSHLSETSIPSRSGLPKPGAREIANDGVSIINEVKFNGASQHYVTIYYLSACCVILYGSRDIL